MASAFGGIVQQLVMGASIVLKLAALRLLWFDRRLTAIHRTNPGRGTGETGPQASNALS